MTCTHEGCEKKLRSDNRSGFCEPHANRRRVDRWVAANSERRATYEKAYREANPEKIAVRDKTYREANRDRILAAKKVHYEANKEAYFTAARRRRARKRDAWVEDYTRTEVWARTEGLCHLCCEPVDPERWDVEHIVGLVIGGLDLLANVAPAHPWCNGSKPKDRAVSGYPALLEAAVAACGVA